MQLLGRHCRQFLQGEDTDLQMLAHLGPVKGACHAGQLQFAVQGLSDTQSNVP